jgi:hypothetical protein
MSHGIPILEAFEGLNWMQTCFKTTIPASKPRFQAICWVRMKNSLNYDKFINIENK